MDGLRAFVQQEEQKTKQLYDEWSIKCKSKNHEHIKHFFDSHQQSFLASDNPALFLENLIKNDDIESVKYILQQINPNKYINRPSYPLRIACNYSTFEMVRLLVRNGAIWDANIGGGTVLSYLLENSKMSGDEIYLCAEYLLTKLTGELHCKAGGHLIMRLMYYIRHPSWDRLKMVKLVKNKRAKFNIKGTGYIGYVVGCKHFDLAEYLMDNGDVLHSGIFNTDDEVVIKWLLKHNMDINGNINNTRYTPLFHCCLWKQYGMIEALIKNGADLNKQCIYKEKKITPLEYCKENLPSKYFERIKEYEKKSKDNILFFGIDLSNIPTVTYEAKLWFDKEALLNEVHDKYLQKTKEVGDMEKALTIKYNELKLLFNQETQIMNTKRNIEKWNNASNARPEWNKFVKQWKKWNVVCFVEYLKRSKYVEKSYGEYYSSDRVCREKIINYIKHNMDKLKLNNEEEKKENENDIMTYFKGIYLSKFDASSINDIGITAKADVESIYYLLQQLIQTESDDTGGVGNKFKNELSEEGILRNWLENIVKLPQYIDVFIENDFNLEIMELVQKDDLRQIGITSVGHQIKIIKFAKELKKQNEGIVPTAHI